MLQDEEVVMPSELKDNIFSEPIVDLANTLKFKRKLIKRVRKHKQLYDALHADFSNFELKQEIWKKIAVEIQMDVEICKNIWAELRYQYQRYVRRLRKFLRYKNTDRKRRPIFALESEMLFLWRFIPTKSFAPLPFIKAAKKDKKPIEVEEDDDIVILDDEPVVIVLDDEDKTATDTPKFKITSEMRLLIKLVEGYPELYDCEHRFFNDYRRKGIIWNAFANESRDKATRLMKLWILLQTRFEWEIWHNILPLREDENDIRHVMGFMYDAIKKNPNTVYKQSLYLKLAWQEPIDHFKNIFNLIAHLRKNLHVINETEKQITPNKNTAYVEAWSHLMLPRTSHKPGQLETTWLILRFFYWELMNMRRQSYQLQDKWYFESIITEMYEQAKSQFQTNAPVTEMTTTNSASTTTSTPVALSKTVHRTLAAAPAVAPAALPALQPLPTLQPFSPVSAPITNSQVANAQTNQQTTMMMPKIVSAKSLAVPQSNNTQMQNTPKGLQIYQVIPQNAMTFVPQPQAINTLSPQGNMQQQPQNRLTQQMLPQIPQIQQSNAAQASNSFPKIASVHTMSNIPSIIRPTNPTTISMPLPVSTSASYMSSTNFSSTNLTTMSNTLLNTNNIPATIMPITGTGTVPKATTNSNPIPVKLVTASNVGLATSNMKSKSILKAVPRSIQPATTSTNTIMTLSSSSSSASSSPVPNLHNSTRTPTPPTIAAPTITIPIQELEKGRYSGIGNNNLNRNEIMIELISTPQGYRLIVHGPPLSSEYALTMTQVTAFIREVMALPLLHNKHNTQASRVQAYWVFIATKFNLPAYICRAIWNFLSENFHHFSKIAPLDILMAPFSSEAKAWQEGSDLFKRFYDNIAKKGWLNHEEQLPNLMLKISEEPILYQDLLRNADAHPPNNTYQMREIWQKLRLSLKIDDVEEIWTGFKSVFWQYMQELEAGYENHWPIRLWRILGKMEFLIYQRYHATEPFYYIILNKFREEIKRCQTLERELSGERSIPTTNNEPKVTPYDIDCYNLLASIRRNPQIYLSSDLKAKENGWSNVAKELKTSVVVCRLAFQRALKNYRSYMVRDPANRCRLNHRYYKQMHAIYRAVTSSQKINIKTPNELNQSFNDAADPNDVIFPERMILDINMDNSTPDLVLKNWMYGIGNCTQAVQTSLPGKIRALLIKYEKFYES